MNEHVAELRKYVAENPPNYGSDAHSILKMIVYIVRNMRIEKAF